MASDTTKPGSIPPRRTGVRHFFAALSYSLQGLAAAWKNESAFRQECLLAIPHIILLCGLPLALWQRLFLSTLLVAILVAELLNTAIEALVNLVSSG